MKPENQQPLDLSSTAVQRCRLVTQAAWAYGVAPTRTTAPKALQDMLQQAANRASFNYAPPPDEALDINSPEKD